MYQIFNFFSPSKYLFFTKFSCVWGAVAKPGVTIVPKEPEQVVLATLIISSLGQGLSLRKRDPARMRRESNTRKLMCQRRLLILKSDGTCLCLSSPSCQLNLSPEARACPELHGTRGAIPLFFLGLVPRPFHAAPLQSSDQPDRKQLAGAGFSLS